MRKPPTPGYIYTFDLMLKKTEQLLTFVLGSHVV